MIRMLAACVAPLLIGLIAASGSAQVSSTRSMVSAAGGQGFFSGYWRCANGQNLSVTPAFGPWLTYRAQQTGKTTQSYVYNDTVGRGWVNVGVDSAGGYWTMTSSGWQGNQLVYNGTYTNNSRSQSQRQVITKNGPRYMTVAAWRNGVRTGQTTCTK